MVLVGTGYNEAGQRSSPRMNTAPDDGAAPDRILLEVDLELASFTVRVSGSLDMESASEFLDRTVALLNRHEPTELVLSVEALSFVDSSGLRTFLEIRDETRRRDISLHLSNATTATQKLLAMVGLDETLEPIEH
jgi:stage II sporulation protein AA (anti-sigma F factor antagonist)